MKRPITLRYEFVQYIPDKLQEKTLYVSIEFATVAHKCCCGCGKEVITPLSPTDWKLTFNGESISLYPSIGNWNFPCRSHYWIDDNKVKWAEQWSQDRIDAGRSYDAFAKKKHFRHSKHQVPHNFVPDIPKAQNESLWDKIKKLFS